MMSKHRSQEKGSIEKLSKRPTRRKVAMALGSAAAGVGSFIAYKNGVGYDDVRSAIDFIIDGQIIPEPSVFPEAVNGMVAVNEGLRDAALPTMVGAVGTLAVIKSTGYFADEYAMSKHDYAGTDTFTEGNGRFKKTKKVFSGVGLAAATVIITGGSSGVEHEISEGPLRPVAATFDSLSNNADGPQHIIVQSENNSFMDDTDVNKAKLRAFAARAAKSGVTVVPFDKTLQNIDDMTGLVITVPNDFFTQATGERIDTDCATIPVILDESNNKKVGDTIAINGVSAEVVQKISNSAQMNREVAMVAEADAVCIQGHNSETTFGAIVSGGKPGEAAALFNNDPLHNDAAMISEQEFNDNNRAFWRKNGTPLLLELMGLIGGLSFLAMKDGRRNELQRNAKQIAMLRSQRVSFQTIKRIETIRAVRDSLKATAIAAPLMPLVPLAFNAAEMGLKVGVGLKEVAVGGVITLFAKVSGSRRAVKNFEKNLDVESALKG